ncbi:peroxisomal membrane protein 2 isoform X2 [Procambarus clarkii]|uniref:peroxisomal membrane protein 2 isoform X2 n=1 Tax=Procambarus clarkii TaxID=6728 RepID=UPI001E671FF3|nr:peroxisomal membrane protein 2-like isoform X2 [Procambarus clarkii]
MVVLSVLDRGLHTYNGCLFAYPLLTKACTSAFTGALGDFLGQLITKQPFINLHSIARYSAFGFVVTGPMAHHFYKTLDQLVPATAWGAAFKRLMVDRFMFAPLLLLLSMYLLSRLELTVSDPRGNDDTGEESSYLCKRNPAKILASAQDELEGLDSSSIH